METTTQTQPSRDLPDWHKRHIPTWRKVLAPLLDVQASRPVHVLEVGCYAGHSASWIARELLAHPESRLTCVDPWSVADAIPRLADRLDEAHAEFVARIDATGRARQVRVWRERSSDALPKLLENWRGALDYVYIDGSHEAPDVLFDSVLALELLKVGGILIWDDYQWRGGAGVHAPRLAIDAVLGVHQERLRVLHTGVQVAVEKTR